MRLAGIDLVQALHAQQVQQLRVAWCDLHGSLRGKTLVLGADAAAQAAVAGVLEAGVGMVSTLLLKDTADRTALAVFDAESPAALLAAPAPAGLARLAGASNVLLHADPSSLQHLPWAPGTAWLRAQAHFEDGTPVPLDTRHALQRALTQLAGWQGRGLGLRVGLELEFHIHRISDDALSPAAAGWPAEAPAVRHIHPGYQLLSEACADLADEPLAIVRRTALALGLPLLSLEIELGPSQVEAVFGAMDALAAADAMVLFRSAVRQALRRAGYHASFACRPPLPHSVASGWHVHQSLCAVDGRNVFVRDAEAPAPEQEQAHPASRVLSDLGVHWLAGLRAHAQAMAALCTPSIDGYSRLRGSLMAPQAALWGFDNRGAMLRVVGTAGHSATRIENRVAEPMANPYLALAAQVWAGLDGLQRQLDPGPATTTPYAVPDASQRLPASLGEALDALAADAVLQAGLGPELTWVFNAVKRQELQRFAAAEDPADWLRREYFGRF